MSMSTTQPTSNAPMLFAICGRPVLHSLSPQLFNAAFANSGINARYTRIRPNNAEQIVHIMRSWPLTGANITTPFKAEIIPYLNRISVEAECIGGVNTVANTPNGLIGYNTDHIGVVRALQQSGCQLQQANCLVLGAGPAAAAAAYGLTRAGARVTIANRSIDKAKKVAQQIDIQINVKPVTANTLQTMLPQFDVVVSALAANVNPLESCILSPHQTILDANYSHSAIAQQAQTQGCTVVSGRMWLLHQAVAAFELMLGFTPNAERMAAAFGCPLSPTNVSIAPLSAANACSADLLIPNDPHFNTAADEEMHCAFGH